MPTGAFTKFAPRLKSRADPAKPAYAGYQRSRESAQVDLALSPSLRLAQRSKPRASRSEGAPRGRCLGLADAPLNWLKRPRLIVPLSLLLLAALVLLGCQAPRRHALQAQTALSPIAEPDDGHQPILDLISSAGSSVDVAIYQLTDSRVVSALEDAAQRGVHVRVLAEPMPGRKALNAHSLSVLSKSGAEVRNSSPTFRLTHEKAIVVDDSTALIMSLNLVSSSFSDSRDVAIRDGDPGDVAEIEAVFNADWQRQQPVLSQPDLVWSPDNSRARLTGLIEGATTELDVYAEEASDQGMIRSLDDAVSRGVHVRLLMTDTGSKDSQRRYRAALEAAGVDVRVLPSPYVHAKVMIVDGAQVFAGSENLSAASLDDNRELGIITADSATIARFSALFEQDWQQARPVSPTGG